MTYQTYDELKAQYDKDYQAWVDGGSVGDPPPRPVKPHIPGPVGSVPSPVAPAAPANAPKGFALPKGLAGFRTNQELEENGAWMPVAEGVRFLVRSQQSKVARAEAQRYVQAHRAEYMAGATRTIDMQDEQELQFCANALVIDWDGMANDDGSPLACTDINVRDILTALPHLRRLLLDWTSTLANYR